jgi:Protein of unknown function (DUF3106)
MRVAVIICGCWVACVASATSGPSGTVQQAPSQAANGQPPAATPIDRWNQMTPQEREKELAKLPPAQARLIRERIRRFNQLPPEEKEALRKRYQRFAELPPAKREIVRWSLRQFRQLPLARRRMVRDAVNSLRALPPDQRAARLDSKEFRSQFSPLEQQIIRNISDDLLGP